MKKLFALALFGALFVSINTMASTGKYRVEDSSIEAVFSASTLASGNVVAVTNAAFGTLSTNAVMAEKNPLVAIMLNFFLGGLAIHRVYLGGKPILILGYLVTCGGIFFVVPLIDLIVLAINYDDISKFVGNSRFFMW